MAMAQVSLLVLWMPWSDAATTTEPTPRGSPYFKAARKGGLAQFERSSCR